MSQCMWAGIVLALGLVLTGCGDGDDGQAAADSAEPTVEESPSASPATGDSDDFCTEMEQVADKFNVEPDVTNPQQAIEELDDAIELFQGIEPPAELEDEWATLLSYFDSVQSGLEGLDATDPATLEQQLEELGALLEAQEPELEAAGSRIDAYLEEECGIVIE